MELSIPAFSILRTCISHECHTGYIGYTRISRVNRIDLLLSTFQCNSAPFIELLRDSFFIQITVHWKKKLKAKQDKEGRKKENNHLVLKRERERKENQRLET